jgi:hypothetical protein
MVFPVMMASSMTPILFSRGGFVVSARGTRMVNLSIGIRSNSGKSFAGDPLLTLYSPEMLASEQEYLVALRARDEMKKSPSREAYENSEILVLASHKKLELWDLGAKEIGEIESTGKPQQNVTLYSPASRGQSSATMAARS